MDLENLRTTWSWRLLSVLRLIAGLMFVQHGLSKYLGWPASSPPGFQLFSLLAVAGVIEIAAGVMIAIGLYTRSAAFLASGMMAFAYFMSHAPRGFFPQANGGELAILYCFLFLYFALAGGGPWTADAWRARAGRKAMAVG